MTKLSELMPAMANILGIQEKSVRVIAMHLRKNGLISSGGRGRGGADMTCQDVTNLMLGIMGSRSAVDAPDVVKLYRSLTCNNNLFEEFRDEQTWGYEKGTDYYFGLDPQKTHTLGQLLDGMFYYAANHGDLGGNGPNEIYNRVDIFINNPEPKTAIHLSALGSNFNISAYFTDPRGKNLSKEQMRKRQKEKLETINNSEGLEYTVKATLDIIMELGAALRGEVNLELRR